MRHFNILNPCRSVLEAQLEQEGLVVLLVVGLVHPQPLPLHHSGALEHRLRPPPLLLEALEALQLIQPLQDLGVDLEQLLRSLPLWADLALCPLQLPHWAPLELLLQSPQQLRLAVEDLAPQQLADSVLQLNPHRRLVVDSVVLPLLRLLLLVDSAG